ncbi:MAG TPA: Rieske (2Fe-2S) protein [Pseudonocardiaceae bacterium]|nr:Rieske (2Fe-2S) protein [Pseudonocardiaceae bacterium]
MIDAVELGRVADFGRLPARVEIVGSDYFLTRDGDQWRLFSAVCPHTGGDIEDVGDVFRCPNHSWAFDRATGMPFDVARWPMSRYDVEERDGVLVAHVETGGWPGVRARQRREDAERRRASG